MESNISGLLGRFYARRNDGSIASYVTRCCGLALQNQQACTANQPKEKIQVFIDKKRQEAASVRPVFRPASALPHHENHHHFLYSGEKFLKEPA